MPLVLYFIPEPPGSRCFDPENRKLSAAVYIVIVLLFCRNTRETERPGFRQVKQQWDTPSAASQFNILLSSVGLFQVLNEDVIFLINEVVTEHTTYGVTKWLIVISSKSDKFFERHLPGRLFVPSPPICHFSSFSSRDFPHELSSNRDEIPIRPHRSNPLDLSGFLDVSASVAWVYYKTKGHRKSLML